MSDDSPYGIGSWYPVVRGGRAPRDFLDALDGRTPARLAKAWPALKPGDRLVLRSAAPPGSRPDTRHLERELESDGSVERFVVSPGTGGSFTLLPTVDGAALRGGLPLLPSGRPTGRALWKALGVFSPLGVAQRLGRPELAIWTKGGPVENGDLPVLPVAGSIAVAGGVPGGNQKVIVRALDRRGTARAILKIGRTGQSDDAVRREATTLERIGTVLDDRAPKLLAQGERNGRAWHAQEVIDGRRGSDELSPDHVAFLQDLATVDRGDATLQHIDQFRDAKRHLDELDVATDPDWHSEYTTLLQALEDSSEGASIPVCAAHGDFTPWNLLLRRGRVRAFDWEYFNERAPILYDAIHFHAQTSVLVKHKLGERVWDDLAGLFAGPLRRIVEDEDLSAADVMRALGIWVLHEGTTHEAVERSWPSPFEQAGWLRHARRAMCRRIAGLLAERTIPDWIPGRRDEDTDEGRRAAA